jgi:hypothetical protein
MIANSATTRKWEKKEKERKNTGIDLSSIL